MGACPAIRKKFARDPSFYIGLFFLAVSDIWTCFKHVQPNSILGDGQSDCRFFSLRCSETTPVSWSLRTVVFFDLKECVLISDCLILCHESAKSIEIHSNPWIVPTEPGPKLYHTCSMILLDQGLSYCGPKTIFISTCNDRWDRGWNAGTRCSKAYQFNCVCLMAGHGGFLEWRIPKSPWLF